MANDTTKIKSIFWFLTPKLILCILIIFVSAYGYFVTNHVREIQDRINTKPGALVSTPCSLRFSMAYDREPVELRLIAPDGTTYDKNHKEITYTDTGDEVSIELITEKLGDWQVSYNRKRNKNLKPTLAINHVDKLFVVDAQLTNGDNHLILTFQPQFGNGSLKDKLTCDITMTSSTLDTTITNVTQEVTMNQFEAIVIEHEKLKTADDWKLHMKIYDKNDPENKNRIYEYDYPGTISFVKGAE